MAESAGAREDHTQQQQQPTCEEVSSLTLLAPLFSAGLVKTSKHLGVLGFCGLSL